MKLVSTHVQRVLIIWTDLGNFKKGEEEKLGGGKGRPCKAADGRKKSPRDKPHDFALPP